jgi:hypothetical protein
MAVKVPAVNEPRDDGSPAFQRMTASHRLARFLNRVGPVRRGLNSYLVTVTSALGLAITVRWTWQLWLHRTSPPNLPISELASHLNWAAPIVALATGVLLLPRAMSLTLGIVLVAAILGDQIRTQPEVVSLALLMIAPQLGEQGRSVARWHLSTMWTWAGIHKALSLGWAHGGAQFIAAALGRPGARVLIAFSVPALEITLGVTSMFRRLSPVVRWVGFITHVAIFLTLSPLFGNWNSAVWPWNISVAIASLCLFARRTDVVRRKATACVIGAVLIVYPALFYLGLSDAYLSHNLYSSNTATAAVCSEDGRCTTAPVDTWSSLNVPLPPEPRIYRAWFEGSCAQGTTLEVIGPTTRLTSPPSVDRFACPPLRKVSR